MNMNQLKITVLNDNTAGRFCLAEHGLSFLLETPHKYLFDTAFSNVFIENALRLKVDLDTVETVVLSHGHDDHSGGLRFLRSKKVVAHSDIFKSRYRKKNNTPLGIPFSRQEAETIFGHSFDLSKKPVQLDGHTWFLGEIPRITSFETSETAFVDENGFDDCIPDDSGMVVKTSNGLVVVSGCAHSGICNMVLHACEVTGTEKVHAVVGGFHLVNDDERTRKTIDFLKKRNIMKVMPSHCTMLPALSAFHREFGFVQVKSGNIIVL